MEIRSIYNRKTHEGITFTEPSKAKQAFAEECEINNILKKYEKTGLLNHVNSAQGVYGDFSNVKDYQTSIQAVMTAQEAFMGLPARIRERFENDPAEFLAFMHNPKNREEAQKMGLLKESAADMGVKDSPKDLKSTPTPQKEMKEPKES